MASLIRGPVIDKIVTDLMATEEGRHQFWQSGVSPFAYKLIANQWVPTHTGFGPCTNGLPCWRGEDGRAWSSPEAVEAGHLRRAYDSNDYEYLPEAEFYAQALAIGPDLKAVLIAQYDQAFQPDRVPPHPWVRLKTKEVL